jgi:hypothetical protein
VKTILYGHAWMAGALTAFAFSGFLRAFSVTPLVWIWVSVLAVGLLWTVLGFSYVARRDGEGAGEDDLEGAAPVAGPSRRRGAPARYAAPLLVLLACLTVAVLLAGAAGGWWSLTTRPTAPRPFINTTAPGRR